MIVRIIKPPVNFYQKIQIIRVPTSFPALMVLVKTQLVQKILESQLTSFNVHSLFKFSSGFFTVKF